MNKVKVIALYLPQFHSIPENDKWWGEGFTEWFNVRKALPLYKGHNQPRIPLNNNYYNLLNEKTFSWQVNLAKEYGIDGFCFYHYWFDGKLLLEKPLENWLSRPELNLNYCFSWANEPWARTWDGLNTDVLMPQKYSGRDDIEKHINYLLPFFKDSRYIKIDNKPVFVLYRTNTIEYLNDMITIWNSIALDNGFSGIYFVETISTFQTNKYCNLTDGSFFFEPSYGYSQLGIKERIFQKILKLFKGNNVNGVLSYSVVWKSILKNKFYDNKNWAGAFIDWDNTPRKKKKGSVYLGVTPNSFHFYFKKLYEKCKEKNVPYIFVNAWNEWCEGTYLEPDEKNKYAYLEIIKEITSHD